MQTPDFRLLHVSNEDRVLKWHSSIPGGDQQPIWSNKFCFFLFAAFLLCCSVS